MDEKEINIEKIKILADNFGEMLQDVVFLGGAIVGLLITDTAAPDIRPTMDVDVLVGVKSRVGYYKIEETLKSLGFKQRVEDGVICRWQIESVIVDIMPPLRDILGFTNNWYKPAMTNSIEYEIDPETKIRLITAPYFLATKIEAFKTRGREDYMMSHDLEDILNVVNGRVEIVNEIEGSEQNLKDFIKKYFNKFYKSSYFTESVRANLQGDTISQERFFIIEKRIERILQLQ